MYHCMQYEDYFTHSIVSNLPIQLVMFIIPAHGLRSIHLLIFNQRTELPYPSMLFLTPYTRSRNKNQHFVFAKYLASWNIFLPCRKRHMYYKKFENSELSDFEYFTKKMFRKSAFCGLAPDPFMMVTLFSNRMEYIDLI